MLNDGTLVATYSGRRNIDRASPPAPACSSAPTAADLARPQRRRACNTGPRTWSSIRTTPTQNTWYAGVFSGWGGPPNGLGGLYKTTDRGLTWTRVNSLDRVTSVTFNPADPNEMYLTTETDGLWVSETDLRAAAAVFPGRSYPFRQPERVFFNPYNPTEIWVSSFGNGLRVGTTATPPAGSVKSRLLFYNNSKFDGANAGRRRGRRSGDRRR